MWGVPNPLHGVERNTIKPKPCYLVADTWESITWSWKSWGRRHTLTPGQANPLHGVERCYPLHDTLSPLPPRIHYMELKEYEVACGSSNIAVQNPLHGIESSRCIDIATELQSFNMNPLHGVESFMAAIFSLSTSLSSESITWSWKVTVTLQDLPSLIDVGIHYMELKAITWS